MVKTSRKAQFLIELKNSYGIVSTACSKVGISRYCFYDWCKKDVEFKKKVEEINESIVDVVEAYLLSLIKDKNPTAIIFYLKTRGRNRGYNEKIDISANVQPKITLEQFRHLFESDDNEEFEVGDAVIEKKTKPEIAISTEGKPITENKQIVGVVTADIPKGEGILCPDCKRMWMRPKEQNASGIICKTCGKWLRNE